VKQQTTGIKFTHRPKISIFAPQGRLVAPIHVKFGTADGHVVCAWPCKIVPQSVHGGQKIENFHFLIKSRPAGANPLIYFYKC